MTTMVQFLAMTQDERSRCRFAPLGDQVYGGLGYILPNKTYWTDETIALLTTWCNNHNVRLDGPVLVFPDDDTFVLCKLIFE